MKKKFERKVVVVDNATEHFMERALELARKVDRGEKIEPSFVTYVEKPKG
jgi:hypothetical protein